MLMTVDDGHIMKLLADELARAPAPERREHLSSLLVPPSRVRLGWEYGETGERLDCWLVGRSPDQEVLLLYCTEGFGPSFPWGFVFAAEDSMGMDCQWHSGLGVCPINRLPST
jgi:hypothetical protein